MNPIAAKPLAETQVVPLIEAVLCVDCEMLSNSTQGHCLACGSRALLSVATALGGPLHARQSAIGIVNEILAPGRALLKRRKRTLHR